MARSFDSRAPRSSSRRSIRVGVSRVVLALALATGCAQNGTVQESRAPAAELAGYRTAAIEVATQGMADPEKDAATFLSHLEGKLRAGGFLEPRPIDKGAELVIRVRMIPNSEEDVRFAVDLVDAGSRRTVGQITVTGTAVGNRIDVALRHAGDEVFAYLRAHHRESAKRTARGLAPPPPPPTPAAPAGPPAAGTVVKGACSTLCKPDSSSELVPEDRQRVAEAMSVLLSEVRTCLDRVNAEAIEPAVILRFEAGGVLTSLRIDAGGFEDLACITEARRKQPPPRTSRAAAARCDHRCQKP